MGREGWRRGRREMVVSGEKELVCIECEEEGRETLTSWKFGEFAAWLLGVWLVWLGFGF